MNNARQRPRWSGLIEANAFWDRIQVFGWEFYEFSISAVAIYINSAEVFAEAPFSCLALMSAIA